MSTITVYLDRNKPAKLQLLVDGSVVSDDAVTRATLWIPPTALVNGSEYVIDTDDGNGELTLVSSSTELEIDLSAVDLKPGVYTTRLSVYDASNLKGIAWDSPTLEVKYWPPTP